MPIAGIIWLVAVVTFIILEASTYQMVCVWFIVGSIGGMIASLLGAGFWVQMTVFLVISIALLVLMRPIAIKRLNSHKVKTNADSLIGKKVLITEKVDNTAATGQGKIDGIVWTVRAESDSVIEEGTVAEVKRIEGVKLIVG